MRSVPPTAWLLLIVFCGLCLRLALFPAEGYGYDVHLYKQWSQSAAAYGPSESYEKQIDGNMTPDYPPFSLLLFWGLGKTADALPSCTIDSLCLHFLVKLPGMLSDLAVGCLLYYFLIAYVGARKALAGAALYIFNPVTWYDSAVWGQTDGFYTLFMVGTLLLFAEKQWFLAGVYAALAITTKLQSIIIFPLLPFLLPWAWRPWLRCTSGAVLMLLIVFLPFLATPGGFSHVMDVYLHSVGKYPVISANGYNFWWSLLSDSASGTSSSVSLLGFISYRMMGLFLALFFYLMILLLSFRGVGALRPKRDRAAWIFLAASTLSLAFFLFNTEMHERYLFPFVALFLPVALLKRGYLGLYVTISLLTFINILGVLPALPLDKWFYAVFPSLDVFIASILVCSFFLLFSKLATQSFVLMKTSPLSWNIKTLSHPKKKTHKKKTR